MPHKPVEPAPDSIDPRAPAEAPRIDCPTEQPGPCAPEYACPSDPNYAPDQGPQEEPTRDPDI